MEKGKKPKYFLNQPVYPGGPKALSQFIRQHLRYPDTAAESGVEGTVALEYDIDYRGVVTATRVLQGIGAEFDEEACRVVRLLRFDVGKNRGLRVIFHQKAYIEFKKPVPTPAPAMSVQYVIVPDTVKQTEVYEYSASI
jgi:TonB family protein